MSLPAWPHFHSGWSSSREQACCLAPAAGEHRAQTAPMAEAALVAAMEASEAVPLLQGTARLLLAPLHLLLALHLGGGLARLRMNAVAPVELG